jgi:DMSO reductase family type II enzyme heme b subunit
MRKKSRLPATRGSTGRASLACATLILLASFAAAGSQEPAESTQPEVQVVRAPAGARLDDLDAPFWRDVPRVVVPTLGQTVVAPMRPEPAVSEIGVAAGHDGHLLAVRLDWSDAAPDIDTVVDRFGDQVAIQFPAEPESDNQPMPMMGHVGAPVRILQWRAVLQHELEHGAPTISDLYPNAVVDLYPDRLLSGEEVQPYAGGRGLGNPVSRPRALSPVVSHVAHGFGSLTATFEQEGGGTGTWREGRWHVVITYPLAGSRRAGLRPGSESVIAFAVWDGGQQEVGGRKAWTPWVPLRLEQ